MNAEQKGNKGLRTLAPQGKLTIENASEFRVELLSALSDASALLIDMSGLEEIDLSGVQLIYSARRSALSQGKELHLVGLAQPAVVKRFAAGGFLRGQPRQASEAEAGLADF